MFVIEDKFLRHAIQGKLKSKGMFADSSFNTELVKIDRSSLETVIRELYGKEIADDFRSGFEAMESQLEEKDDIATETTNAIIQFAVSTIKSLGYEYIKSRIGF